MPRTFLLEFQWRSLSHPRPHARTPAWVPGTQVRDHCTSCNDGEASNPEETDGLCVSCYALHKGWFGAKNKSMCLSCEPGYVSICDFVFVVGAVLSLC